MYDWDTHRCGCGRLISSDNLCPHCDQPCPHTDDGRCSSCKNTLQRMDADRHAFAALPPPAAIAIHDRERDVPVGAVDRCGTCGGRSYHTASGPWCPRPFCTTSDAPQTT